MAVKFKCHFHDAGIMTEEDKITDINQQCLIIDVHGNRVERICGDCHLLKIVPAPELDAGLIRKMQITNNPNYLEV